MHIFLVSLARRRQQARTFFVETSWLGSRNGRSGRNEQDRQQRHRNQSLAEWFDSTTDRYIEEGRKGHQRSRFVHQSRLLEHLRAYFCPDDDDLDRESHAAAYLPNLLSTYPRYLDRKSRAHVQACLRALLRDPRIGQRVTTVIVDFLSKESVKGVIAPSNAYVLLEWCCLIQDEFARQKEWPVKLLAQVYAASACFLDKTEDPGVRRSIRTNAEVVARRGVRVLLRDDDGGSQALSVALEELTSSPRAGPQNSAMIGVIARVCQELPRRREEMSSTTRPILDFYIKHILNSKTAVSPQAVTGLTPFFKAFVTEADFEDILLPATEKSILRSAEVVLDGPIAALANSINREIDLAPLVQTRLSKPLLASLASNNVSIKNGACKTLQAFLSRGGSTAAMLKFTTDLITALKGTKAASHELRALLCECIAEITPSTEWSGQIVDTVTPTAVKETNENTLVKELDVLARNVSFLVQDGSLSKNVSESILKACNDKRPSFKKAWHLCLAASLFTIKSISEDEVSHKFVESALGLLKNVHEEISPNPLPALQSGLVAASYALPAVTPNLGAISGLRLSSKQTKSSGLSATSVLLNSKVYSRLSSFEDKLWAMRALFGVASELEEVSTDIKRLWARGMLHFLLSNGVEPAIRREAATSLSAEYIARPAAIGRSMILGSWDLLEERRIQSSLEPATASLGDMKLRHALRLITQPQEVWSTRRGGAPTAVVETQAVKSIVLLRPELVSHADWIESCLAQGLDPGTLGRRELDSILQEIISHFSLPKLAPLNLFEVAACNAAANLAFVAPDVATAALIAQFSRDLDPQQLVNLGPTEAAIARAPEGVVYVDVLAQQANGHVEDKNRKDYDILKWEEDTRKQLAAKKGVSTKKLTPDQQAKVTAQLKHETDVRAAVRSLSLNLRRGSQFIKSLAQGPPIDARLWVSQAITALTSALQAGASLFIDDEALVAYLACANQVADRLGNLRPFIGIATLRSLPSVNVPVHLAAEPLGELGTRVLYRLRFAAEQRPFDTASFGYMLPLIFSVLDNSGIGEVSAEDADAQVLLALEFLSFQVSQCEDIYLPRNTILGYLILSMQKFPQHYRLIKDSLTELSVAIANSLTDKERDTLFVACTAPQTSVRSAVLQAIQSELALEGSEPSVNIWIACQDEEDDNAELALAIWEESEWTVTETLVRALPAFLYESTRATRLSTAKALAQALASFPDIVPSILEELQASYREESQPMKAKPNKYGIVQKGGLVDQWQRRSGLALAIQELARLMPKGQVVPLTEFLVKDNALSDRHATVRAEMLDAGKAVVASHGSQCLEPLMSIFEDVLQQPDKGTQEYDWTYEAVIVLYGSLAQHLPAGDKRFEDVISKLLTTLSTPSESVQYAVAQCLPPLVRAKSLDVGGYLSTLLEQLCQAKQFAARRGAAYGLAGMIQGKGVASLRQYRVMSSLRSSSENRKSAEHRQGALFAYELLSFMLGRVFEPYVIEILPQLLACFGDPSTPVREACLDAAKTCFSNLSSFGVRKVLPQLLEGLDETQWRSKKGACDLLGAMAYLDPQQLATSLPDIIPPLTAVLTDSHKEVRSAANKSLQRFGEVITNPEVKGLVDVLLKALSDPTKYTEDALDGLIKISFIHYLDAPSLALVVRILERGLGDRSATKRKAAQIIGSLANLTEKRDIVVHLPILVSGLRDATVDPVPSTRATASKALGSLVEKLGEDAFPDLIPSLMASLRTDTGAGDRLGSAQALSEVLAGLGTGRLEATLPTILQNVASARATVREGFMTLFIFLPACFGNSFANYLSQIIPSVLAGLADDLEAIRDTALRAGRLLVKNFATKAIDLLLPELQRGLADDSYRIRLSSVELVGDLLFSLTGTTAKADDEEDEGEDTVAQAGQSLLDVLGEERRDRVLSSLYICRCDTSGLVRAAAINVWKALVATPRTLREIVPTLMQMIITRLASSNMEHKVIAGNALGEVIRKAGEGVFTSLLPSLEEGLQSTDSDNRQGICMALREIVNAAAPESLENHEKQLIAIVRIALVDSDREVREAAAESFDALQQTFGKRAVDQVLPHLLHLLRSDDEAENALSALLTLLTETTRANVILPNLIPTLLTNPITAFNARALASLARVGGSSMTRRLPVVLNNLAENIVSCRDDALREDLNTAFDAVLGSVDEYDGLNTAMSVMLAQIKHDDHRRRAVAASHLASFFATTTIDYSRYNQDLIRVLLISFGDRDNDVVRAAWSGLSQLQSHLRKEEMETLVASTRSVLQQAGVAGSILPGFALPKGIQSVLQIFLQGLMNGTTDQRIQAAMGISDIIDRSGPESLKPFVTQITGPLIRVVGERSVDVKCAILYTLNQLLEKIPTFLRPFLPQLQRTFTKSIADPSSDLLRTRATKALSTLITLTPRVDPLIAELVTGAKTQDAGVRNAMLKGLQEVVSRVGANMSDASRESILGLMDSQQDAGAEAMMMTNAKLLGAMIKVLPGEKATTLIKARVLVQPSNNASILAVNAVLVEDAATITSQYATDIRNTIASGITNRTTFIQHNAVLAAGKYLLSTGTTTNRDSCTPVIEALATAIAPGGDIDTRRLALVVIRTVSRHHSDEVRSYLPTLIPPVFSSVRDPVIPVKLAAEAAFLELLHVVDEESAVFDAYMAGPGKSLGTGPQRAMTDYFKRVALRLGAQARERQDAEGGAGGLGLSSDEQEDEREVWSVGRVEVGDAFANDE